MNIDKNISGHLVNKEDVPEIHDCKALPIYHMRANLEIYEIEDEAMPYDLRPKLWYVTFNDKKLAVFNDMASAEKYHKAIVDEIAPIIDKYNL